MRRRFDVAVPRHARKAAALDPVEEPFIRVPRIVLRHAAADHLQPDAVELLLRSDGRRHDDGKADARIERHLARFGPKDVGPAQAFGEFVEIVGTVRLHVYEQVSTEGLLEPELLDLLREILRDRLLGSRREPHRDHFPHELMLEALHDLHGERTLRTGAADGKRERERMVGLERACASAELCLERLDVLVREDAVRIQVAEPTDQVLLDDGPFRSADDLLRQRESREVDVFPADPVEHEAFHHAAIRREILDAALLRIQRHPRPTHVRVADDHVDVFRIIVDLGRERGDEEGADERLRILRELLDEMLAETKVLDHQIGLLDLRGRRGKVAARIDGLDPLEVIHDLEDVRPDDRKRLEPRDRLVEASAFGMPGYWFAVMTPPFAARSRKAYAARS